MSVSVEQQPLHFGQSPSSPTHNLHAPASSSPPPPSTSDIDMSSSITTTAPAGQPHDRQSENLEDSHVEDTTVIASDPNTVTNGVAVEVSVMEDDAMDTTPDIADTELVLADPAVGPLEAAPSAEDGLIQPETTPGDAVSYVEYLLLSTFNITSYSNTLADTAAD